MNAEVGNKTVKELGDRVKFWETDMLKTESIEAGVNGIADWVKQTV